MSNTPPQILMVSKPVAPPWNDSSKNLVRDLSTYVTRHRATVLTQDGVDPGLAGVTYEQVYGRAPARFAPALASNARVFMRLLAGRPHDLWHFFFAPNPRSSAAGAFASAVRRKPTVQTVCSAPLDSRELRRWLFADRVVVLSASTEQRFLAAGVPASRLRRIAPAVAPLELPTEQASLSVRARLGIPAGRPLVVYPGDLEFSAGAECAIRAHARLIQSCDATLVLACRAKTPRAHDRELRLRALAGQLGVDERTLWLGELSQIHGLLATADVVALPADTLYAKMDLPLVLIEAMMLGRPVLTTQTTAAAELGEDDAALTVPFDVEAVAGALARLLTDPDQRARLGQRARAAALSRYHPSIMATAYEKVYDELLT
jgi:glycosyltransferase involved in cell wall biosynthesis